RYRRHSSSGIAPCARQKPEGRASPRGRDDMRRRPFTIAIAAAATVALGTSAAAAQEGVKIGMSFSMTGAGVGAPGREASAGARLYMQHHGNTVAGQKVEIIL